MGLKKNKKSTNYFNDDGDFGYDNKYILCGPLVAKSIVIIYNILFLFSGILLILFGIWTITSKNEYAELLNSLLYMSSTYILMTAGSIIILTSLLGIFSAWFEKRSLILVFLGLLCLILLIEATAGVLALIYHARLKESLQYDLETAVKYHYNQPGYDEKTKLLDNLQAKFKCCGAKDFRDWSNSKFIESNNQSSQYNQVAESCCITPSNLCAKRIHPSNIYFKGCVGALKKYISNHIILLGFVGLCSFSFQSIGIILTLFLLRRIKNKKSYEHVQIDENES